MTAVPSKALASLGSNLVRIWGFDAATQRWQLYDPLTPSLSDLTFLLRGHGYWINVTMAQTLIYGGYSYPLQPGWNLIGWVVE
jgi:hypothetical protein